MVVGKPRGEDDIALMREIDAPTPLRTGGCRPPHVLVVVGRGQIVLQGKRARGQRSELLAHDRFRLRDGVHRVGERASAIGCESQRPVPTERLGTPLDEKRPESNAGPLVCTMPPEYCAPVVLFAVIESHSASPALS